MSDLPPKRLKNGKAEIPIKLNSEPNSSQSKTNNKMEDIKSVSNERGQVRSPPSLVTDETQQENEERFGRLQSEIATLKMLTMKSLEPNAETSGRCSYDFIAPHTGVQH